MEEINQFLAFKSQAEGLLDRIDQLNNAYKIGNKRVDLAKMKVGEAVNLVSKIPDGKDKKLSDEQTKRILNMVFDLNRGKREIFILLKMSDGNGIYDPLTGKTFLYE